MQLSDFTKRYGAPMTTVWTAYSLNSYVDASWLCSVMHTDVTNLVMIWLDLCKTNIRWFTAWMCDGKYLQAHQWWRRDQCSTVVYITIFTLNFPIKTFRWHATILQYLTILNCPQLQKSNVSGHPLICQPVRNYSEYMSCQMRMLNPDGLSVSKTSGSD